MEHRAEQAAATFGEGYNCAQAVLSAFAADLGLPADLAIRLAGPFGGGIGGTGKTCGALSGALMALGLKFAVAGPKDLDGKQRVYALARELCRRFQDAHGSIVCSELVGHDISTPEGMQKARDSGIFRDLCPRLVRAAAEIAQDMLAR